MFADYTPAIYASDCDYAISDCCAAAFWRDNYTIANNHNTTAGDSPANIYNAGNGDSAISSHANIQTNADQNANAYGAANMDTARIADCKSTANVDTSGYSNTRIAANYCSYSDPHSNLDTTTNGHAVRNNG